MRRRVLSHFSGPPSPAFDETHMHTHTQHNTASVTHLCNSRWWHLLVQVLGKNSDKEARGGLGYQLHCLAFLASHTLTVHLNDALIRCQATSCEGEGGGGEEQVDG